MNTPSPLEQEIKQFIIETLVLEDVSADDIDSQAPLFGEGLGLDSVDALELGVELKKRYGIRLDPKDEKTREYFSSVRSLAQFVESARQTS